VVLLFSTLHYKLLTLWTISSSSAWVKILNVIMSQLDKTRVLTSIVQPGAYIGRVVAYGSLELEGVQVRSRSGRRPVIGSTGAPRILPGSGIKKVRNIK
jgi:hypothetical protein